MCVFWSEWGQNRKEQKQLIFTGNKKEQKRKNIYNSRVGREKEVNVLGAERAVRKRQGYERCRESGARI